MTDEKLQSESLVQLAMILTTYIITQNHDSFGYRFE